MGYVPDWPLIGEFFRAAVPSLVAIVVAYIAWRQWQTAKDKLAIDLFDRRFQNYRALMKSIEERVFEISSANYDDPIEGPPVDRLKDFWRLQHEATFLFGREVRDCLSAIEADLLELAQGKIALASEGVQARDQFYDPLNRLSGRKQRFAELARPYMMLDKIAVNEPSERRSFFWMWR